MHEICSRLLQDCCDVGCAIRARWGSSGVHNGPVRGTPERLPHTHSMCRMQCCTFLRNSHATWFCIEVALAFIRPDVIRPHFEVDRHIIDCCTLETCATTPTAKYARNCWGGGSEFKGILCRYILAALRHWRLISFLCCAYTTWKKAALSVVRQVHVHHASGRQFHNTKPPCRHETNGELTRFYVGAYICTYLQYVL